LKLIGISHFDRREQVRFLREARAMARLSHPNAVVVYDSRITPDVAFIEMEYLRGQSLNQRLKPGVPMLLERRGRSRPSSNTGTSSPSTT
jgi:serine/threonine protein kinase